MNDWHEHYRRRIDESGGISAYVRRKSEARKNVLARIEGEVVAEVGCGTGVLSTHLALSGRRVYALDNDPLMLSLASEIAEHCGAAVSFQLCDLRQLALPEPVDCIFSVGVLEHFIDDEIIDALRRQLQLATSVVFVVPSDEFGAADAIRGDERFMSSHEWGRLIKKTDPKRVETFHFDSAPNGAPRYLGYQLFSRRDLKPNPSRGGH